ncbi:MAG: GTPase HflX, partial [Elusimicrobiota bacterium]
VYADDKLFATLDPTTRRVRLPAGGWTVFTDTVGFISKLPTTLIAAFRSTLEELTQADCLLLLEDGLAPFPERQRRTVTQVLGQLGAVDIPCVTAVNKMDLLSEDEQTRLRAQDPRRPLISAKTGDGVDTLLGRVQEVLDDRWLPREIMLDPSRAGHLDEIYRCAQVLEQATKDGKILLRLRVTQENWSRLVRKVGAAG